MLKTNTLDYWPILNEELCIQPMAFVPTSDKLCIKNGLAYFTPGSLQSRDGSGLIFSGSGQAQVSYFGLGLFQA